METNVAQAQRGEKLDPLVIAGEAIPVCAMDVSIFIRLFRAGALQGV